MCKEQEQRPAAIRLSGVKKMYKLGQIGGGTLQADLQSWWARVRGKEDPNSMIGTDQRLVGKTFMALNGVDLTIYQGEAVGIIGSNGAGKSTMLKLLSRVTAPTEGDIDIYGRIASMLEVGTGFNTEMTGRENVYLNGAILGMTRAEIDAKMEQIIAFSEVRDFIDTPVKRYSSGMYVKLAFSVAAHLDSEIMIMDEVLAVGDMAFQKKCLGKMREAAKQEGRTVLYVSHNMNTIRQLCDRCIVLDKGKVIFDGDVEQAIAIYSNSQSNDGIFYDFSQWTRPAWLGNQQLKLLSAEYAGKSTNVFDLTEPIRLKLAWTNIKDVEDVCVRIEVLSLEDTPLGTYNAMDVYSGKKDDAVEVTLQLDTSMLAEAVYKMRLVFFYKDSVGNNEDIDFAQGLCFTKAAVTEESNIQWRVRHWGYFCLPEPVVQSVQKKDA